MHQNALLRQKLAEIQAQGKADRQWWDKEKASIQSNFMKELGEDARESSKPATSAIGDKVGSDEDAVLVESGGPAASGSVSNAKGGTKKRKGKK